VFLRRPGESRAEAEDRIEREWLVEVAAPELPAPQEDEGPYATVVRRLNEDNRHTVYAGDLDSATKFIPSWKKALQAKPVPLGQASWLLNDCSPIPPEHALAIVLTALRRNPNLAEQRFEAAQLVLGIRAERNAAVIGGPIVY
jgi:hypothetical protein